MLKTKNEELFNILMSNDFNLGEYNFETPSGSVKLVKFIENNLNQDFVKVELSLNGTLILTLKDSKDFPDGLVEGLYCQKGNDNLEIYNIVNADSFTIYGKPSKSCFQRIEIENNRLYGMRDGFVAYISAEICYNVIFWGNGPISYDLDEKQFYLDIDNEGEWESVFSFNSVDELIKLREKAVELKEIGDLGAFAANLVQKYIFDDIDLEDLEKNAKGFRELVEFYNKYYVNREAIYEKLDSNPVFKLLEAQVKEIIKEQEKNKQVLTRTKEL